MAVRTIDVVEPVTAVTTDRPDDASREEAAPRVSSADRPRAHPPHTHCAASRSGPCCGRPDWDVRPYVSDVSGTDLAMTDIAQAHPADVVAGLTELLPVLGSNLAKTVRRVLLHIEYVAIRHTERLAEGGFVASVASTEDRNHNAMAEAFNSLFKAELLRNRGPWSDIDDLEIAVAEHIDWFNHRCLHGEHGVGSPVEDETHHRKPTLTEAPHLACVHTLHQIGHETRGR